jgi:hypothetical protein
LLMFVKRRKGLASHLSFGIYHIYSGGGRGTTSSTGTTLFTNLFYFSYKLRLTANMTA